MSNILSEYVRELALWREEKAEEYPDDERNTQSAEALNSLAQYVESEEVELMDPNVRFLNNLDAGGHIGIGESLHRLMSRYGFGYAARSVVQHEAFLDELAVAALKDLFEDAGEQHQDWSGVLTDAEVEAVERGVRLPQQHWERRRQMTEAEIEEAVVNFALEDAR
jgi:hypothetical protein